ATPANSASFGVLGRRHDSCWRCVERVLLLFASRLDRGECEARMTTYDYVVIGAGSAGCVIAHRLGVDKRTRVLVLDAGSSDDSPLFRRPGMLALIYQIPKLKEKSD